MSVKLKPNIEKCIFQIRYKPLLPFYDKLFSQENIFSYFPHWQTDRLKIILRDFDKQHNLVIKHDSITYETDKYSRKIEEEVLKLVESNINNLIAKDNIIRYGHKFFTLIPLDMDFDELVPIINLKFYESGFLSSLKSKPDDSSVMITSKINELIYHMHLGPIKNVEIPKFIKFNIENHIDPSSPTKYSEIAKIFETYPKTALYFEMDIYTDKMKEYFPLTKFYLESITLYNIIIASVKNYIFENKIK